MNEEICKDIPDYEGYYQASTFGNIRSVTRFVNYKNLGAISKRSSIILSPKITSKEYLEVVLVRSNSRKCYRVHKLIAMTFLDNPHKYPYINHINENKQDNRVENLEWCSPKQNNDAYYGKKLIGQYNLEGHLLHTYTIYENAGRAIGGNKHDVYKCCKGLLKTYKGFIWKLLKH